MDSIKIISLAGLSIIFFKIYLSIREDKNKIMCQAADKLFESFIDEIQGLSLEKGDAYEILRQAFSKHEKAYTQFRPYLSGKVLRKFDEAWREYSCGREENSPPFLEQYFAAGNEAIAKEKRKLALKKILKILSFAKKGFVLKVRTDFTEAIYAKKEGK